MAPPVAVRVALLPPQIVALLADNVNDPVTEKFCILLLLLLLESEPPFTEDKLTVKAFTPLVMLIIGGKLIVEPKTMPGYGRYCVIQDPAGAACALFKPE